MWFIEIISTLIVYFDLALIVGAPAIGLPISVDRTRMVVSSGHIFYVGMHVFGYVNLPVFIFPKAW